MHRKNEELTCIKNEKTGSGWTLPVLFYLRIQDVFHKFYDFKKFFYNVNKTM